jgi:hypothetical protein
MTAGSWQEATGSRQQVELTGQRSEVSFLISDFGFRIWELEN